MYCTHCGTINPETVESCLKCGRGFMAPGSTAEDGKTAVDLALAARSPGSKSFGSGRGRFSRSIILSLAVCVAVMVPALMIMRQAGTVRPASLSEKQTFTKNVGGQGGLTGMLKSAGFNPGAGVTPSPPAEQGAAISPRQALAIASDAAHKANALRLKTAVSIFAEEHNRFPVSINEIPPSVLGFVADPNIYKYWRTKNPEGYHIEVLMESGDVSGADIVTENGITKYVVNGTWD